MQRKWVIVNTEDDTLTWSNSEGFTYGDDFEVFSDEEKEQFHLPIGGEWRELQTL